MTYQSVLAILVPEAEPLVESFRNIFDPSALEGMPAHITINYPFLPMAEDSSDAIPALHELFAGFHSFAYSLVAVKRFPWVAYLEPNPSQPFIDLIQAVAKRFPQSPPYGGTFAEIIPHLTVAEAKSEILIERIGWQFARTCDGKLPIKAVAKEVWLLDNKPGTWTKRTSFSLKGHL